MDRNPLKVKHPYYAHEGCYWAPYLEAIEEYDSWEEFLAEFGNADIDMNLVIRWDWNVADPNDYDEGEQRPEPYLQITMHGQRKGTLKTLNVRNVTDDDAPAVVAYLRPHLERILDNWRPISHEWVAINSVLGGLFE